MTNARIKEIAPGVTSEVIAEQTHLFYDPQSGSAKISFQYRDTIFVNGAYAAPSGEWSVISVDLAAIAERAFGAGVVDPVSGVDLSHVSSAGMLLVIKAAFDVLFNEFVAAPTEPEA